jgi:hypothetical protein
MFSTRWRLFRLLGIPISLDASWLVILVLVTWTLMNLFEEAVPGLPSVAYWCMGLGEALTFFGSPALLILLANWSDGLLPLYG